MYCPPAFREDRLDVLHEAIGLHPLGLIVTSGACGLVANALPFSLHRDKDGDVLRAHMAKANDQIADLRSGGPALVIFQGPQGYISPSSYVTKRQHGKVVPTWNYIIVQVHGTPRIVEGAGWLLDQVSEMTARQEAARDEPWAVDDAPGNFIAAQIKGIIGLEIQVSKIEGKWKLSQNQPLENRIGVIECLDQDGRIDLAMAVKERVGS